jgi:hypothetical protein
VKPTRSQKSTETTLRSSRIEAGAVAPSGAAQYGQNGKSPGSSLAQFGQVATPRVSPKPGVLVLWVDRVIGSGAAVTTASTRPARPPRPSRVHLTRERVDDRTPPQPTPVATPTPAPAAVDLSGTWTGSYSGPYNGTFTLTWSQTGSNLDGTIHLSSPASSPPHQRHCVGQCHQLRCGRCRHLQRHRLGQQHVRVEHGSGQQSDRFMKREQVLTARFSPTALFPEHRP